MIDIKFKWDPRDTSVQKTKLPQYENPGDAGLDLMATVDFSIEPGRWAQIPTGWAIELPIGYEAQVRPRSGLAVKYGITVLNSPGTIDSGYRDEIVVLLINHSQNVYTGKAGERIAQLVIAPVTFATPVEVSCLSDSERGKQGLGSTGK